MSNPFLFDDDEVEPSTESAPNPFLLSNEPEEAENPFLSEAVNPFAFDGGEENTPAPAAEQPSSAEIRSMDKAMSFFGTTITEDDDHEPVVPPQAALVAVEEPTESAKKGPPPRPTPPNPTTQDLISSVADQLDQNSSHLLDRIPKTRTPSPVSMRDLHTPSPTPETANLLMSDVLESNAAGSALRSDNPFADIEDEPAYQPPVVEQKIPPRPAPPRPSPSEQIFELSQQSEAEADLFDFGTNTAPKPQVPKSNQDILNLFAAPKAEPQKQDLLTSDILLMDNIAPIQSNLPTQQVIPNATPAAAPIHAPVINTAPIAPVAPAPPAAPTPPAAPPARPAPPQRPAAPPARPAPPAVSKPPSVPEPAVVIQKQQQPIVETTQPETKTIPSVPSVEDIPPPPPVENEQPKHIEQSTDVPVSSIKINDEPYNGLHDTDKSDTISENSSAVDSSIRTPGIATPFYSPGPDAQYLDRGQTPVDHLNNTKEDMINTYINEASAYDASAESNPFGSPESAVTPQQPAQIFQQNDTFDAFAAKFDSVKKDDGLLDSFGGGSSGYKSPAPSDGNDMHKF